MHLPAWMACKRTPDASPMQCMRRSLCINHCAHHCCLSQAQCKQLSPSHSQACSKRIASPARRTTSHAAAGPYPSEHSSAWQPLDTLAVQLCRPSLKFLLHSKPLNDKLASIQDIMEGALKRLPAQGLHAALGVRPPCSGRQRLRLARMATSSRPSARIAALSGPSTYSHTDNDRENSNGLVSAGRCKAKAGNARQCPYVRGIDVLPNAGTGPLGWLRCCLAGCKALWLAKELSGNSL